MDCRLEVLLVIRGDLFRSNILPFELITHAATGEDGHVQFSAAEATILHKIRMTNDEHRPAATGRQRGEKNDESRNPKPAFLADF